MTIGYLSPENPFEDRTIWSGTIYKIREAIERSGYEVKWIPFKENTLCDYLLRVLCKLRFGRKCNTSRTYLHYWYCARTIDREKMLSCDLLFCPYHYGRIVTFLGKTPPLVTYNDCTPNIMIDYYWFGQNKEYVRKLDLLEKELIRQSLMIISSSRWACDSIIKDYGGSEDRTFLMKFGANIDDSDIVTSLPYEGGRLNVLFCGVDWVRKGGAVAVNAVSELRKAGINAKLLIAGIKQLPKECENLSFIEFAGFLNKNNRNEYQRYIGLWRKAHICLLPTRAECSAIIFSEAAGFGVPVYTCDTGGLADYVENGVNGYRLPLHATGVDFSKRIVQSIQNNEFPHLRQGALRKYEEELSWTAWSRHFKKLLNETCPNEVFFSGTRCKKVKLI